MQTTLGRLSALVTVILLAPLPLLPVACGPANACSAICVAVADCDSSLDVGACTDGCMSQVDTAAELGFGDLAEEALNACRSCLESNSCLSLAGGACNAACPSGTLPTPYQPPGAGCNTSWSRGSITYGVECDDDEYCDCYVGGVRDRSFKSPGFCSASGPEQQSRASRGCDWGLEACGLTWTDSTGEHSVACRWPEESSTQLTCECHGTVGEWLWSSDFCVVDDLAKQAQAEVGCAKTDYY